MDTTSEPTNSDQTVMMVGSNTTTPNNISLDVYNGMIQFISREAYVTFFFVAIVLNESVCVLGVITNIINIIVFVKLGLRETTSISMMSLAVSDLLLTSLGLWSNLLYLPQFPSFGIPVRTDEIFWVTGGTARQFLGRTSALITTFISAERCLCVMVPLKVKNIITRTRTIAAMVIIFTITLGPSMIVYVNYRTGWYYYADVNQTLLGARYVDGEINNILDRIIFSILGAFLPQFSFVSVCICTVYLVIHLRKASKFRKSHTTEAQSASQSVVSTHGQKEVPASTTIETRRLNAPVATPAAKLSSTKEDRVAKTVVIIAVAFIVCFFPGCVAFLLYIALPGFTIYGVYAQMFLLLFKVSFLTEPINSSVNLFIYYSIGTNFRATVDQMFCRGKKK